jgi:phosphate starvation-inducible PhoH-like protein
LTERTKLAFDDQRALAHVLGTPAESKRISAELEQACGVQLHLRGSELTLEGGNADAHQLVSRLFTEMVRLAAAGKAIARADVLRALRVLESDADAELSSVFDDVIIAKTQSGRGIAPRSLAQKRYIELMRRKPLVFGVGPAGTGKTFLAVAMAVRRLLDKQVRRIILTRPAIEAGESLGFLPGSFEEKVSPYMRPLYDGLEEMLDYNKVQRLTEIGAIEIAPLAYMRGRTLNDAFVILDEAQNATRQQMKMLLTRIGTGTSAVVTGDPSQVDLPKGGTSGLWHALSILRGVPRCGICRFEQSDVMRHPLVADIIKAYDGDAKRRQDEKNSREPKPSAAQAENPSADAK